MTLRRHITLLALLCTVPILANEDDEVGSWQEIGIEKAINKKWDIGLDLEYRAQHKARFSAGLGTSYKPWKFLKLGIGYNFLYTCRPDKRTDKNDYTGYPEEYTVGYNFFPEVWFPRHRFSAEATGSVKLWGWLKLSLRERYQITHGRGYTVDKYKYRKEHRTIYDTEICFDDNGDLILDEQGNPTFERIVTGEEDVVTQNGWDTDEPKYVPAHTDQVLRSRIKLEYDKKRCPFSPFISAEAHNSVSVGEHMLLQKVRTAVGCGYKFRKQHEVSLAYIATFYMYDIEDGEVIREHDRRHIVSVGYKYSF